MLEIIVTVLNGVFYQVIGWTHQEWYSEEYKSFAH